MMFIGFDNGFYSEPCDLMVAFSVVFCTIFIQYLLNSLANLLQSCYSLINMKDYIFVKRSEKV